MLTDSHAHLDSPALFEKLPEILDEAASSQVTRILTIGCVTGEHDSVEQPLQIATTNPGVVAAFGVHPHNAADFSATLSDRIEDLMTRPRVVAWGEIGLDFYYDHAPRQDQLAAFRAQLEQALRAGVPVIIHSRSAATETAEVLEEYVARGLRGVMHCFTYDRSAARRYLDLGFYLSFGGILTFPSAEELRAVASQVPADRYLIETDSPYLAPVPFRGKTNQPAYVKVVAERLAVVRGCDLETVARESSRNFDRLFGDVECS